MKFIRRIEIGLIITLCIIFVGLVFFSVFGFNKVTDYDTNYQVLVSVDQDIDGEGAIAKETADKYFNEVGVKVFKVQTANEGTDFFYTLAEDKVDMEVLKDKLQTAVGESVVASCSIVEVREGESNQIVNLIIAIAVATVVILAYLLIAEKAAVAFTVILNSVFASILTFSLFALTRIPIFGMVEVYIAASYILCAIFSTVIASRMRETASLAGNEKMSYKEIAEKSVKESKFRFIAFIIFTILVGLALVAIFTPHLICSAGYVVISSASAMTLSILGTMFFWPIFKSVKK